MSSQKNQKAAKAAAVTFSTTTAVVSTLFDIVGAFFKGIPSWIKWLVSAGIGLIASCFSARSALNAETEREQLQETRRVQHIQLVKSVKKELHEIKSHLDDKEMQVVHKKVHKAYERWDNLHRQAASNDRFFKEESMQLLESPKTSDSEDDKDDKGFLKMK